MTNIIIQLSGIFLGVFSRTLLPFLRKLYQGKVKHFQKKYLYQAIAAFLLSLIFFILIFPHYSLEIKNNADWVSEVKLFCMAFAFGFGFNSLINEAGEWFKNGKKY